MKRDGEALRRVAHILRFFGGLGYTSSPFWEPHTPTQAGSVFASRWPLEGGTLWTLVNRAAATVDGPQLSLSGRHFQDHSFWDCYHGKPLSVHYANANIQLSFEIEGLGYGCVFASGTDFRVPDGLQAFLGQMASITRQPLAAFSDEWSYLKQTVIAPHNATRHSGDAPTGMVMVPAATFRFTSSGVEWEGTDASGGDVQFSWESHPQQHHVQVLRQPRLLVDVYPVTCSDYAHFLEESGYVPNDSHNWLRNWNWNGSASRPRLPAHLKRVPVTYVSFGEARKFCAWHGKRLPETFEWQYAAQGGDPHAWYPWGQSDEPACRPALSSGQQIPGAEPVDKYACGASKFGVRDLVANVWQMTSAFEDPRTRSVVLKGGSNYRPNATVNNEKSKKNWYYPQARDNLTSHNRMLLMSASYERAGTVGFRCVQDIAGEPAVRVE